jgi:hypothetical protein
MRVTSRIMGTFNLGALSAVLLALTGCGSSSSSPPELSNFTGTAWSGADTATVTCAGKSTMSNGTFGGTFAAQGTAGLQFTSKAGCTFDFAVSGDMGTASNAPVTCSTSELGAALVISVTAYTIMSSDGAHLTGTASGTLMEGGASCTFVETITATR